MEIKKLEPISIENQKQTAELYIKYRQSVFNHVLSIVKNYHDSEDVTTKVFIKIMNLSRKEATQYNPERRASEATWIHTITNSVIIDFFRTNHQDKYKAIGDYVDDEGRNIFINIAPKKTNTDSDILTNELQNRIKKAFSGLKPKYRFIAKMYFKKEYSYKELSEMFDLPMGSIKGTINRIRQKLQTELSDLCIQKNNVQNIEA